MRTINLTKLLKGFNSGWVAISPDYKKVIASGKTLQEVSDKVNLQKLTDVFLLSVSKNYRGYVTSNR